MTQFEPKNELEQKLLDAQEGKVSGEDFMRELIDSQVFMPVFDKVSEGGIQLSNRLQPLVLDGEDGRKVLVLFTSPDRARGFVRDYPGYGGGLLDSFRWVLEKMGVGGFGIALNPGWDVGIDLGASTGASGASIFRVEFQLSAYFRPLLQVY
jgi:hypothetical protein